MITITLDSREAAEALKRLADAATDLRPALEGIGGLLQARILETMGRGQTPWGEPFAPLKKRKGVPLNNTRQHLYNRITFRATSDGVEVGLLDAESNKIGRVHQFGATIQHQARMQTLHFKINHKTRQSRFAKKGKANFAQDVSRSAHATTLPARPFLPIRPDGEADLPTAWEAEIVEALRRHLQKAMP